MKFLITFAALLCFVGSSGSLFAQNTMYVDPNKPFEQLNRDEADIRIQQLRDQVAQLEERLNNLNTENSNYQKELSETIAAIKRCEEEILALLGISNMDIEGFRQRLGVLEGKTREMARLSDKVLAERRSDVEALENELNGMRKEKPSMLPEFYDRIIALARDIRSLYRTVEVSSYTVGTWAETRDCLWNISAKPGIYNDPFQWPKIWSANYPLIKNTPDLIYPGWVLIIPPKGPMTPEDVKAERKYYRQKRAAQQSQTGAAVNE